MRYHLPLGEKVGSSDGKKLGESESVADGVSDCSTLGAIEIESEGLELGIMDGIELGKYECSALGIPLGDAIGVSTSVTTSSSICVAFVGCFLK